MALLRLLKSETFRLVAMGFMLGSAGVMLTQPAQAGAQAPVSAMADRASAHR